MFQSNFHCSFCSSLNNWLNEFYCFAVLYIAPAIDIADGCGHSKEAHHELLLLKKNKIRLY